MRISRKIFVVPLADNDHGKSTIIRALVSHGLGKSVDLHKKGVRSLVSPHGRVIDAYVFGRSYQEVEKQNHFSVEVTLDANDKHWRTRELIVMPSHVAESDHTDISQMIDAAHSAGFDVISVSVLLIKDSGDNRDQFPNIWRMNWDERWTIPNHFNSNPEGQLKALGYDLWTWICRALTA